MTRRSTATALFSLVASLAGSVPVAGCAKSEPAPSKEPAAALPIVRDETTGLLFTYIDATGNFHVESDVPKVPADARERVRVLDATRSDPEGRIFVADLRQKLPDGTYPVATATRASFDALAASRRATSLTEAAKAKPAGEGKDGPAAEAKSVVVYGASWCGACQKTRAYLKQKHVPFVDKDIDNDSSAAREMRSKLGKAGIEGSGIPVIDVGGKLMVGFDPGAIDRALGG